MARTTPDQAWAATLALLAIHQVEEAAFPMGEWQERVGLTGWEVLDRFVARSPLSVPNLRQRLAVIAAQAGAAAVLYLLTRRSPTATRVVTSGLCLGWGAAFVMHIAMSIRTRSAMPGVATSIAPGLVGVAMVLRYIWR